MPGNPAYASAPNMKRRSEGPPARSETTAPLAQSGRSHKDYFFLAVFFFAAGFFAAGFFAAAFFVLALAISWHSFS